jgi:hypothetical protein
MLTLQTVATPPAKLTGQCNMLNINGLTQEQVEMLDIIWSFDTKEEYESWFELLDDDEASMCFGLMELLTLAIIDEALESKKVDPYKEANQVINQIKSKFDTK